MALVRKDWWEEPPPSRRDKHVFSTNEKVGAGVAGGAVLGAGAAYLATRGKGSGAVKTVTRTIKLKPKATKAPKEKAPEPEPPKHTGMRAAAGPVHPVAPEPPMFLGPPKQHPNMVIRQRERGKAQMDKVELEQSQLRLKRKQEAPPKEKPPITADGEPVAMPTDKDGVTPEQARRQARRAAARVHGKPGKKPRGPVKKMDESILAKRFALDVYDEIWKKDLSLTGEPGDKRNTKYALAGGVGYVAGANIGSHLGARMAGTTYEKNRRQVHEAVKAHTEAERAKKAKKFDAYTSPRVEAEARRNYNPFARKALYYDPRNPPPEPKTRYQRAKQKLTRKKVVLDPKVPKNPDTYTPSVKTLARIHNSVKGTKALVGGSAAGAVLGVGAGAGAVAVYRKDKKKRALARLNPPVEPVEPVTKAEDPRRRIDMGTGAVLGGVAGAASGNAVAIPAARMAAKMGKKGKAGKTFTQSLIRFNKSPIVLAPIGLGVGLGAIAGKGAKDMRDKEVSKAEEALLAARRLDDPVANKWDEISKISLRRVKKPKVGDGPGAQVTPGSAVKKKPVPYRGFSVYDPIIAAQRGPRTSVKNSFRS